jgi:rhamnulokinase
MSKRGYLAFDLGAESGRAMLATIESGKVTMHECHRFPTRAVRLPSGYHWDLTGLWANLVEGLRRAGEVAREQGITIASLGVDTWGVDFGLIGRSGRLLGLPYAYRDEHHPRGMTKAVDQLGKEAIYEATGLQFLPFNTLFQLIARRDSEPMVLEPANHLLNMPDLLHFFFSGQAVNESTIASTTQMIDPRTGKWATDLLNKLHLPHHFLRETVPAGTKIGAVRREVMEEAGLGEASAIDVIVPGSHDTASAIAAVPVDESKTSGGWAYLSSGTWSLMGAELDEPIISEASRQAAFTNERGVAGKIRFLKNISGLWLVQQTRADFAAQGKEYDYAELTELASEAEPFRTLIDPDHEPFASPGGMLGKVDKFAASTDQPKPETPGQYVRCCLESLALTYRRVLASLDELLGRETKLLHLVGGGGKNELLNQMTADAINRSVIVGPYEGTAVGNALTQAIGAGDVKDLNELRQIVRASFELTTYEPKDAAKYDAVAERFASLLGR